MARPVDGPVFVVPLRERPECVPFFARQFVLEWPAWYGPGGQGSAMADLNAFANAAGDLPTGVVAQTRDGAYLGVAALKAASIPEYSHLGPWAAAGYVVPGHRGQGVGTALLDRLLDEACRLGFSTVYCATASAVSLLRRQGWQLLDTAIHDDKLISIFSIEVPTQGRRDADRPGRRATGEQQ
jgi:GNAT superfamily N-acetyltransferase